jgi:heme-degrading monooxygenase HmoA
MVVRTPSPPYYAVIFTSQRTEADPEYGEMAERMENLAKEQAGFLGIESFRDPEGAGVTISYWDSLEAIRAWKRNREHLDAQERGKEKWYAGYTVRVCRVEYDYVFGVL